MYKFVPCQCHVALPPMKLTRVEDDLDPTDSCGSQCWDYRKESTTSASSVLSEHYVLDMLSQLLCSVTEQSLVHVVSGIL